jgi:hypothetical protein
MNERVTFVAAMLQAGSELRRVQRTSTRSYRTSHTLDALSTCAARLLKNELVGLERFPCETRDPPAQTLHAKRSRPRPYKSFCRAERARRAAVVRSPEVARAGGAGTEASAIQAAAWQQQAPVRTLVA